MFSVCGRVLGAESGGEQAEAAAIERAAGGAGAEGTQALGRTDADQAAGDGVAEAVEVDALVHSKVGGSHGAVEGDEAGLIEEPGLDRGVIAVGEEGFGILANEVEVEAFKQVVGAIAAAGSDDGCDVGIGEGGVEIGEALVGGAGEVGRMLAEGVRGGNGIVAKVAEDFDGAGNAVVARAAGRGEHDNAGSGRDGAWLEGFHRNSSGAKAHSIFAGLGMDERATLVAGTRSGKEDVSCGDELGGAGEESFPCRGRTTPPAGIRRGHRR